ncbi:MAG: YibE/F family protein [Clostridia bacterium]|nr:YibE/F family protein [Clostridia bacterium]
MTGYWRNLFVCRSLLLLLSAFFVLTFVTGQVHGQVHPEFDDEQYQERYERAIVLEITDKNAEKIEALQGKVVEQEIKVRLLDGSDKGKVLTAINTLSGSPGFDLHLSPGDKVVIYIAKYTGDNADGSINTIYVSDRVRSPALVWIICVFAGLLLIVGRLQGAKALFGLGVTILGIYKVLLPGLIAGKSPLPLTVMVLIAVTLITMICIAGFSRKALAATLGTLGGLIVAGWLAYTFGDLAQLSGLATEEDRMLMYVENINFDMRGLLFAGILIGAVGAIMDVTMSVASAISEIKRANPDMKTTELVAAGMNVGRDIMGTMANTLILAYTGGALPFILLFMVYEMEPLRIVNWELIVTEIIRALVGSIALIISVPITAVIAGWLTANRSKARA